ncbi:small G protein signaling modulator 3 [Verticillium alfalfae VaMs.102]|uniref:Small G protein signaling modulator 3 n=1 Tax=Verticillium alfalfae (strain VaMs.102 / ATCC MYA-4576 / FGSC 10136) TaxID=526221 RepID=C9SJM6_VERA1|nr:small G protein signaling modulator 3 [Verticillium alfalfae VaMs.102]EEY19640.1 small G protein signaling modulator 3 [Verticillium alfalfae VaMs.102]
MDDDASTPTPAQATPTMPAVAVAAASPRTRTPTPPSLPLERSISQRSVSVASVRSSSRSTTLRTRSKRLPSHVSSSASSIIAADDKSLTSFPSLSPESPKPVRPFADQEPTAYAGAPRTASGAVSVAESDAPLSLPDDTLTEGDVTAPPALPTRPSQSARSALFEDSPIATQKIPGALHTADDEHLDRLVKRHGAKELVRMIATDLAHRDAQIALLRRKADERERALRKIILECERLWPDRYEGTIRATSLSLASNADPGTNKGTTRGWKDFLWGGSKRGSVASSINGDDPRSKTIVRTQSHADRRPGLQDDLFNPPPDTTSLRSASRASSISSVAPSPRKPSGVTASLLRLVAGGAMAGRDVDPIRGRSNSATHARQARASSSASGRTTGSSRAVSNQSNPKALMPCNAPFQRALGGSRHRGELPPQRTLGTPWSGAQPKGLPSRQGRAIGPGREWMAISGPPEDAPRQLSKGLGDDVVREIKADVTRTLTHNTFFRNGAPGVQRLDDILTAYACRNPHIGYCQGMNLITANLLLVTPSAEDAFWILARIVESICPTDYYDKSLLTARADQQVLRQLVTEILPRLSDHLDYLGVDLQIMSFQWFLSVFTDCLSAEALFRVWDVVLCMEEGSLFLFQVAVALLKLNETQILQCDSSTAAYTYLNHQMTNHAISIDNMIKASEALRRYIQKEDVDARRKSAIQAMKIAADEREEANAARRAQREDAETAAASV